MQLVAERPVTDTIRAQMNYIVDTGVPPVRYIDWPEMAHKEIPPQYRSTRWRSATAARCATASSSTPTASSLSITTPR